MYKLRTVSHNMFRTKPTEEGLWAPAERPSLPVSLILEAITSFPSLGLTFPSRSNAKRNTCLKYGIPDRHTEECAVSGHADLLAHCADA